MKSINLFKNQLSSLNLNVNCVSTIFKQKSFAKNWFTSNRILLFWTIIICICLSSSSLALGQDVKNSDHKADKNLKSSSRINPTTLAMEFSLPLGSYPGRAGNSLPVGINYTSKVWRTQPGIVWWTTTPSGYPIFHTDTNPVFAQRSAAGWTSTLSPPHIIEKLEIFDENGDRVSRLLTLAQLNELNSNEQSNLLEYCTRTCRVGIVTGWTYECTPWTCVDISCQPGQACDGGGPRGGWGEPPPPPVNTPPPPPPRQDRKSVV